MDSILVRPRTDATRLVGAWSTWPTRQLVVKVRRCTEGPADGDAPVSGEGDDGLSGPFARVMPDVARGDDEDDVLGDVGGVIADTLQVP